jgi:hypothetical protein
MPITIKDLTANEDLVQQLGWICDFEPQDSGTRPAFLASDDAADFVVIGHDGTGGEFAVSVSSRRIFYFSSEGQAGIVANNLDAFISLIVSRPFWQDILKYAAHGSLDEMRRADIALEDDWSQDREFVSARELLRKRLGLGDPGDIVGALHKAVSTQVDIRDLWDAPADSLFGRFTIDDNPMLRFSAG